MVAAKRVGEKQTNCTYLACLPGGHWLFEGETMMKPRPKKKDRSIASGQFFGGAVSFSVLQSIEQIELPR